MFLGKIYSIFKFLSKCENFFAPGGACCTGSPFSQSIFSRPLLFHISASYFIDKIIAGSTKILMGLLKVVLYIFLTRHAKLGKKYIGI